MGEEGCGTVDFVQIELQHGKTLLLDVKIRVSALLYRSLSSRVEYKFDCEKKDRIALVGFQYQLLRSALIPNLA